MSVCELNSCMRLFMIINVWFTQSYMISLMKEHVNAWDKNDHGQHSSVVSSSLSLIVPIHTLYWDTQTLLWDTRKRDSGIWVQEPGRNFSECPTWNPRPMNMWGGRMPSWWHAEDHSWQQPNDAWFAIFSARHSVWEGASGCLKGGLDRG